MNTELSLKIERAYVRFENVDNYVTEAPFLLKLVNGSKAKQAADSLVERIQFWNVYSERHTRQGAFEEIKDMIRKNPDLIDFEVSLREFDRISRLAQYHLIGKKFICRGKEFYIKEGQ